ncbi:MAG: NAD-dependent malic enzyme [bacterium]|nr:NAD-dependent malic enzyme [bacterium]
MDYKQKSLDLHKKLKGKIYIPSKEKITPENLSLVYTPGVAEPCKLIAENAKDSYQYTARGNMVGVISDGSAVLGLGNIGALAAMPVMEGKCVLFKEFAGVDAFPICLNTQNVDELINIIKNLEPTFGALNLEDISAPRCFEIEQKLKKVMDISVFHDDQHGTAVVVLAGLINALKLTKKSKENIKVVISGSGAAGTAITNFLLAYGVDNIIICDRDGILEKNSNQYNIFKKDLADKTNKNNEGGSLADAFIGADVFIGVSVADIVTREMIERMNDNPIIFALANPNPEILPDEAKKAGAKIISTGRSDFPNQINNVLAFPGILRGALAVRATDITENMKIAASIAIATLIPEEELSEDNFIPRAYNLEIGPIVAASVAEAAIKDSVARVSKTRDEVIKETKSLL